MDRAEAAATIGRFWEMHDLLYENQGLLDDRSLVGYATQLGLGTALIESALRGEFSTRVRRDFTSGVRSGVNGTPSLFVNGQRYDGPRDADSLMALFNRMGWGLCPIKAAHPHSRLAPTPQTSARYRVAAGWRSSASSRG